MKSRIISNLKLLSLALLIGLTTSYVFAWTGPTAAPTGGNTSAPLNVSSASQTKVGSLRLAGIRTVSPSYINFPSNENLTLVTDSPAGPKPVTFGALSLGVSGKIGATHYCDANGANCVLAANLGTGTGGSGTGSSCSSGVFHGNYGDLGNTPVTVEAGGKSVTAYPTASAVVTGGSFSKPWRVQPKSDGGVWKVELSRVGDTSQTVGPLYFDLIYSSC